MSARPLPRDLIALVHHVELTRAGWRDQAFESLLQASLLAARAPLSPAQLTTDIQNRAGIYIGPDLLQPRLDALLSAGRAVEVTAGCYRLSEAAFPQLERQLTDAATVEEHARATYLSLLESHSVADEPDAAWRSFNERFLQPLIAELGARTYELLALGTAPVTSTAGYRAFITECYPDTQEKLREVLTEYLTADDARVRSYILRQLHASFLVNAARLEDQAVANLVRSINGRAALTVFLDTNYLFSILDLHDNPSNEPAVTLHTLIEQLKGRVAVRLVVLPETLDELRRTIAAYERTLDEVQLTPKLGRAAQERIHEMSGIVRRYFRQAAKVSFRLSAKEYFEPYSLDPVRALRSKGVDLFNADTADLAVSQAVVDDILHQQDFEKRRYPDRAKSYETVRHDVVLWHFARGKRDLPLDSALEARYWVATIDFRFLGFDSYKRRRNPSDLPVCVHPTTLAQLLHFWLPRTPEADKALVASLLPMVPSDFDAKAEKTTISILRSLSRYENLGDLPDDTITAVLGNEALRQRLASDSSIEEQIVLVREAIIGELDTVKRSLDATSAALEERTRETEDLKLQVDSLRRASHEQRVQAQRLLEQEATQRSSLEVRLNSLEHSIQAARQAALDASATSAAITSLGKAGALRLCIGGLIALVAGHFLARISARPEWLLNALFCLTALAYATASTVTRSRLSPALSTWPIRGKLEALSKALNYILLAVGTGVLGNFVWDLLRR